MGQFKNTKHAVISGYNLYIFDDVITPDENNKIARIFMESSFTRTESDRDDTSHIKSWAGEIDQESIKRFPIYCKSTELLFSCFPSESYRMYRSYCNVAFYGDMLFTHKDSDEDEGSTCTALWFIGLKWDVEWGGETIFFNNQKDAEIAVSPKPGRVVLFDGRILHAGRPPNRVCFEPRFTVALKFEALKL